MPPKQASPHPCIFQHGRCHYGSFCAFKELPGNSCLFFLQHQVTPSNPPCRFGSSCSNAHLQIRKKGDSWVVQPPSPATPPLQKPRLVPAPSSVQTPVPAPAPIIKAPQKTQVDKGIQILAHSLSVRNHD